MKLVNLISIVAFMGTTLFAQAQNTDVPTPEFKNKVQYIKKDNTLIDLDVTDLKSSMTNNMGGTAKIYLKAKGDHAAIKRSGSVNNRFIVWLDAGIDPANVVELFKFEDKGRKFMVAKNSMGSTKDIDLPTQKLIYSKVKDGVYIVSPAAQLEPGEYVFTVNKPQIDFMSAVGNGTTIKGYAFYVQAADSE